ncbi:cartilage-associated protein-like [Leptidea sinapis]|nr:cartilage-associated protein-like [Leptidea sinapis]
MSRYIQSYMLLFLFMYIVEIKSGKLLSLDNVYQKSIAAYTKERWSKCIEYFEESLHLYKLHKTTLINCRLKCKNIPNVIVKENIEDLKIYEKIFKTSQCLQQCTDEGFDKINMYSNTSDDILSDMQQRKPYEYLHICYFQMNALPKAASAAYTFLVANPFNDAMKKNLDYYIDLPEVDINEVDDLESEDYQMLYRLGLKSYNAKQWGETIANMEESLTNYLSWENGCRAECEWQPEQEWSVEVSILVSNSLTSLLICQQNCQNQLKPLFNSGTEFIADLLNYLQICYYYLERFDDVGKAVESYLLLLPRDKNMLENKEMYESFINKSSFVERSDIVYYFKRDQYEKELLQLFHDQNGSNFEINLV